VDIRYQRRIEPQWKPSCGSSRFPSLLGNSRAVQSIRRHLVQIAAVKVKGQSS
jgi:hypothetical protein